MLGATEIAIIVFALAFFIFGPSALKNLGTAAAETVREFRKVKKELNEPIELIDQPKKGRP